MANPRKFSEKIALHNQKQAEETAAFEKIMREVMGATRGAYAKHQLSMPSLGSYRGGSLPNVNQMSGGPGHSIDLQGALSHLEDMRHGREMALPVAGGPERPHGAPTRERGRHATAPHKSRQAAFDKRVDVSPYSSSLYLSPPPDSSWRRTNSDSALHQSAQSAGGQQDAFAGVGGSSGQRRGTAMQEVNSFAMDIMHLKGYWDPKGGDISRSIYMPQDDGNGGPMPSPGSSAPLPGSLHMPTGPNMGNGNTGSLPDLTSLHFPPPLATPLDPSEELGGQQHGNASMAAMHSSTYDGEKYQRQVGNGSPGGPGSPRGPGASPTGRRGSPGPAPSPSSRRRAHHSSTSVVLGAGGGRHHGSPGASQGQVRVSSPHHHQQQHHHHQHQSPHLPRITVEGLTMDTNALSLDGYGGGATATTATAAAANGDVRSPVSPGVPAAARISPSLPLGVPTSFPRAASDADQSASAATVPGRSVLGALWECPGVSGVPRSILLSRLSSWSCG
ncbi:unnamed protein product [Ixodes hexagonus]